VDALLSQAMFADAAAGGRLTALGRRALLWARAHIVAELRGGMGALVDRGLWEHYSLGTRIGRAFEGTLLPPLLRAARTANASAAANASAGFPSFPGFPDFPATTALLFESTHKRRVLDSRLAFIEGLKGALSSASSAPEGPSFAAAWERVAVVTNPASDPREDPAVWEQARRHSMEWHGLVDGKEEAAADSDPAPTRCVLLRRLFEDAMLSPAPDFSAPNSSTPNFLAAVGLGARAADGSSLIRSRSGLEAARAALLNDAQGSLTYGALYDRVHRFSVLRFFDVCNAYQRYKNNRSWKAKARAYLNEQIASRPDSAERQLAGLLLEASFAEQLAPLPPTAHAPLPAAVDGADAVNASARVRTKAKREAADTVPSSIRIRYRTDDHIAAEAASAGGSALKPSDTASTATPELAALLQRLARLVAEDEAKAAQRAKMHRRRWAQSEEPATAPAFAPAADAVASVSSTAVPSEPAASSPVAETTEAYSLADMTMDLYELCQVQASAYGDYSKFCSLFNSSPTLRTLLSTVELVRDIEDYFKKGSGSKEAFGMSCLLVEDLIESTKAALAGDGPLLHVRHAHAETLIPLIAMLDIFPDGDGMADPDGLIGVEETFRTRLEAKSSLQGRVFTDARFAQFMQASVDYPPLNATDPLGLLQLKHTWSFARLSPMAGNIVWSVSDCGGTAVLRLFHNEREVPVPGCRHTDKESASVDSDGDVSTAAGEMGCPLDTFVAHLRNRRYIESGAHNSHSCSTLRGWSDLCDGIHLDCE
jgi:hypothetical protein